MSTVFFDINHSGLLTGAEAVFLDGVLGKMAARLAVTGRGTAARVLLAAREGPRSELRRRIAGAPLRGVFVSIPEIGELRDGELALLAKQLAKTADGFLKIGHPAALLVQSIRLAVEQERHDRGIAVDLAVDIESEADRAAIERADLESLAALADPRQEIVH